MVDIISSDSMFSVSQKNLLSLLVDLMIPAEGVMPGAADPDIFSSILGDLAEHHSTTLSLLEMISSESDDVFANGFEQLDGGDRMELISRLKTRAPELVQFLQFHTVNNYYQDNRVMKALGMEARPPYPGGYTLEPTDWSLLDPVRERTEIYKKI